MAEAIGLAVGVVGLTALFSTCVECFDYIDTARSYERDRQILAAKLRVERVRLWIWGKVLGLHKNESDTLLKVPLIRATVESNLTVILRIFEDLKEQGHRYGLQEVQMDCDRMIMGQEEYVDTPGAKLQAVFGAGPNLPGLKLRARWALHDKVKVTLFVEDLKALIDGLNDVTPGNVRGSNLLMKREIGNIEDCDALQLIQEATQDEYQDWSETASVALERFTVHEPVYRTVRDWMATTNARPLSNFSIESLPVVGSPSLPITKWTARLSAVTRSFSERLKPRSRLITPSIASAPVLTEEERLQATLQRALFRAAVAGRVEDIQKLVDQGAILEGVDDEKMGILHHAMKHGQLDLLKLMVSPALISSQESRGKSLVHYCVQMMVQKVSPESSDQVLDLLLAHGADIECRDDNSVTPLIIAAKKDKSDLVETLLAAGAVVDTKDSKGRTALSYAVLHEIPTNGYGVSYSFTCDHILKHGANPNAKDNDGNRPIHHWASKESEGDPIALDLLAEAKADIDARNEAGHTALSLALEKEMPLHSGLLVEKGARIESKYPDSTCELVTAVEQNDAQYTLYQSYIEIANAEKPTEHLHGEEVSCRQAGLWTAVHAGSHKLVKILLDCNAGIDLTRQTDNACLLHIAVENGNEEVVKLLLGHDNIDTFLRYENKDGCTPLLQALKLPGRTNLAILLIQHQYATLSKIQPEAMSPLSAALKTASQEVIEAFLEALVKKLYWGSEAIFTLAELSNAEMSLLKDNATMKKLLRPDHLHVVAELGKSELLRMYLDANEGSLDLLARDSNGLTALEAGEKGGHMDIVKMLKSRMPSECRDMVLWSGVPDPT